MTDWCDECPFCNYAGPSPVLADYGDTFVIEPLEPVTPGHVLVIPKTHTPSALTSPTIAGQAVMLAAQYANVNGIGACNIITSVGPQATQTVFHLHVHLIPRADGDGLRLPWT
jgi:histidine triad (HIT) family protein